MFLVPLRVISGQEVTFDDKDQARTHGASTLIDGRPKAAGEPSGVPLSRASCVVRGCPGAMSYVGRAPAESARVPLLMLLAAPAPMGAGIAPAVGPCTPAPRRAAAPCRKMRPPAMRAASVRFSIPPSARALRNAVDRQQRRTAAPLTCPWHQQAAAAALCLLTCAAAQSSPVYATGLSVGEIHGPGACASLPCAGGAAAAVL